MPATAPARRAIDPSYRAALIGTAAGMALWAVGFATGVLNFYAIAFLPLGCRELASYTHRRRHPELYDPMPRPVTRRLLSHLAQPGFGAAFVVIAATFAAGLSKQLSLGAGITAALIAAAVCTFAWPPPTRVDGPLTASPRTERREPT